jgi:glycerol uptake facilitator-like aquaporin
VRLLNRLLAEFIGSAMLLATVVGSGIMGVNLANGNTAIALLANAGATAAVLFGLISIFAPISGAHFNPLVSLVMRWRGELSTGELLAYVSVQIGGAILGVLLAHAMFDLPIWQTGDHVRTGVAQWLSEVIATFGLLLIILLGGKHRTASIPAMVAAYVFGAYWFTASTAFGNPAVTIARSLTTTFAGIRPRDVFGFIVAQLLGAVLAYVLSKRLLDSK